MIADDPKGASSSLGVPAGGAAAATETGVSRSDKVSSVFRVHVVVWARAMFHTTHEGYKGQPPGSRTVTALTSRSFRDMIWIGLAASPLLRAPRQAVS